MSLSVGLGKREVDSFPQSYPDLFRVFFGCRIYLTGHEGPDVGDLDPPWRNQFMALLLTKQNAKKRTAKKAFFRL